MTATAVTGSARIAAAFATAAAAGRGTLIPYLCAGDPDRATSQALVEAMGPAGADIIELGIPYGDPLADGPTVAAAAQRALEAGTTIDDALAIATEAQRRGAPPILMFTYFNPVMQYGLERFAATLQRSGICGAIVPDMPLEESGEIRAVFATHGLAFPLLVAPTTPAARAATLHATSDGFTYVVSRLGVTSASKEPDFGWIAGRVATLRAASDSPLAIGFGISTAAHVARACAIADGAIVGSALIEAYGRATGEDAVERARAYLGELSRGTIRNA
ncbi:MAG: tryptophan synthase subunit alpha [Vulcanimicrobiaceae bacterium]